MQNSIPTVAVIAPNGQVISVPALNTMNPSMFAPTPSSQQPVPGNLNRMAQGDENSYNDAGPIFMADIPAICTSPEEIANHLGFVPMENETQGERKDDSKYKNKGKGKAAERNDSQPPKKKARTFILVDSSSSEDFSSDYSSSSDVKMEDSPSPKRRRTHVNAVASSSTGTAPGVSPRYHGDWYTSPLADPEIIGPRADLLESERVYRSLFEVRDRLVKDMLKLQEFLQQRGVLERWHAGDRLGSGGYSQY